MSEAFEARAFSTPDGGSRESEAVFPQAERGEPIETRASNPQLEAS